MSLLLLPADGVGEHANLFLPFIQPLPPPRPPPSTFRPTQKALTSALLNDSPIPRTKPNDKPSNELDNKEVILDIVPPKLGSTTQGSCKRH